MEYTNPPKRNTIFLLLTAISNFTFCLFSNPAEGKAKALSTNEPLVMPSKIAKIYNQCLSKVSKKNNLLAYFTRPKVYEAQESKIIKCTNTTHANNGAVLNETLPQTTEPTDDNQKSETVLDDYEKIKNFYAYDPIAQTWIKIRSFKIITECLNNRPIDLTRYGKPYINFWAYDVSNQSWHRVSLISYLQQTNTQINNHSPAIATNESALKDEENQLSDLATGELLEELLGVHTLTRPAHPRQKESACANLSFDFSIGGGAVFYTNRLDNMVLLQREADQYFFKAKTGKIYKPNWFHDTLNTVPESYLSHADIAKGSDQNTTFKGKGRAMPITLVIQYTFWQRLFIGFGREILFNTTSKLVHNEESIDDKEYIPNKTWSKQGRWFGRCGWYPFNNEKHRFFTDIRLFYVHHLDTVSPSLVSFGDYVHQTLAYNFGLGYEQQVTNYLSCTARLAMELQSFKQFSNDESHDYNIYYKQPAIYLQIGLAIRCGKYSPSNDLKNKHYQEKKDKSNDLSDLEGLQDLVDLD